MSKCVIAKVEKGVNYFFHIQAVAKINYNSEYAERYKNNVYTDDLDYLKRNKDLFLFGDGRSFSAFTVLYLFLPSLINLNNYKKINLYFDKLCFSLKEGKADLFINEYEDTIEKVVKLHKGYEKALKDNLNLIQTNYLDKAERAADIFKRNFKSYNDGVWPEEKVKLENKAEKLNIKFNKENIIQRFEKITGKDYKSNKFKVSLCSANKNGPDANDLGYEKNIHFYDRNIDDLISFISHEIGVRILVPLKYNIDIENNYLMYDALESIAEFYNRRVLNMNNNKLFNNFNMIDIYENIYSKNPNISVERLFKTGITNYHNVFTISCYRYIIFYFSSTGRIDCTGKGLTF